MLFWSIKAIGEDMEMSMSEIWIQISAAAGLSGCLFDLEDMAAVSFLQIRQYCAPSDSIVFMGIHTRIIGRNGQILHRVAAAGYICYLPKADVLLVPNFNKQTFSLLTRIQSGT